jgi:hypothetical protein
MTVCRLIILDFVVVILNSTLMPKNINFDSLLKSPKSKNYSKFNIF